MFDPEVDLVEMADAQGAKGFGQCRTFDELESALAAAIADQGGVAVVDVRMEQISRVDAAAIKTQSDG